MFLVTLGGGIVHLVLFCIYLYILYILFSVIGALHSSVLSLVEWVNGISNCC